MATPDAVAEKKSLAGINADYKEKFGFHDPETGYAYKAPKGLSREVVESISEHKDEPQWMREFRLKALQHFEDRPTPTWGGNLGTIDFDDIHYFVRASEKASRDWDEVPDDIKKTFDRLGIPEAERKFLAGVGAQYESEVVYHQVREDLEKQGVIFLDMDSGLREHEDIVREHWATVIPPNDNKLAALNSAVWSGGSFVYVPAGVKVEMPLQAYFRINTENMGQFERTLIIAEEGSDVHYIEGCHIAGSMVRVRDGEKPIDELEPGDEVLTHRGRFRRVNDVMRRPRRGPIHHIRFQNETYRSLAVTPGHPFLVSKRGRAREHSKRFDGEWLTAQELEKGDYLALPTSIDLEGEPISRHAEIVDVGHGRGTAVAEKVEVTLDARMCRLIGLYLAEGSVPANTSYLNFDSAERETEIRVFQRATMLDQFGIEPWEYEYEDRAARSLRFSSVRAARFFSQAFGRTTAELRIPGWVFSLGEEERAALVRGLYDGEGSYDENLDLFRINQTNQGVAQRLRELLLSLGIRASLSRSERPEPRRDMWQIAICKVDHPRFETLVLGRQPHTARATHAQAVIADGYLWMPISSIEQIDADCEVFNLQIEEDESYVCEGVVSHNCTAPVYSTDSLHSAVVEIICKPGSRIRYTTVQNWSQNVYNLVTKRAVAQEGATMEWVDCNLGSRLTMKYPSIYLLGPEAHGEILSIAFAGNGQHQDAGGKIIHAAPRTSSSIFSKSISKDGGRSTYRGLLEIADGATESRSKVVCDALLLDEDSRSDTYPTIRIGEDDVDVGHEATVSKVGEEQIFYLQSRGLSEEEASKMIVNGFIEPITKELPMEYAVELNRLIELQMEGSIG
ncbi:MAG: Fe-S cluster assembly protein SufB [Chloroflexota bacterium]